MALGKRRESRQQELWIAAEELARTPRHVFYERLNRLLAKAKFDGWVEPLCRPFRARARGRTQAAGGEGGGRR
jgi:transposase